MSVNTEQVITAGLYREDLCELGEMPVYKELLTADEPPSATKAAEEKAALIERNDGGQNVEADLEDEH